MRDKRAGEGRGDLTDRCQHVNVSHAKVKSTWIEDATLPHADDEITKWSSRRRAKRIESEKGTRKSRGITIHHTPYVYGNAKHRKFFDERKLRIDRPRRSDPGSGDRIQIGLPLVSRAKNLNVLLAALKSC